MRKLNNVATPIYITTNSAWKFHLLHILIYSICCLFDNCLSDICEGLWFAFPWWLMILNISSYVWWTSLCFLWKKGFSALCLFFLKIQLFVLFMLNCMCSLLIHYWIYHLQWLLLYAKVRFVIVQIVCLCFCFPCYRDISKKYS